MVSYLLMQSLLNQIGPYRVFYGSSKLKYLLGIFNLSR